MKRSAFRRPVYEPAPAPADPGRITRAFTTSGSTTGPCPKGPPAKPGKTNPTVEERRWLDAICNFGCVACWLDGLPSRPCAVHHILRGSVRMGHLWSLPLCDPGHHQNGSPMGLICRHPFKSRFEMRYGTELELLNMLQERLGFPRLTLT